jgi:hypothetical protein
MNFLHTTGAGSPLRTALTKCVSWCVYLVAFVTMQPSVRFTRAPIPLLAERDDAFETEGGGRLIAGRSSKAGAKA